MKIKNKRNSSTTLRSILISIAIIAFIAVIGLLYFLNSELQRTNIVTAYERQENEELKVMSSVILHLYDNEGAEERVNAYLSSFPASGNRFLVYVVDGDVVFAKNTEVTRYLGRRSSEEFFDAIREDDLCIVTVTFEAQGQECELTVVTTEAYIFDNLDYDTSSYYSFVIVAILTITLLIMVESTVIAWDRAEKKYGVTSEELKKRNSELEVISMSLSEGNSGDSILDPDGISTVGNIEFYNVYTMKALLEKSQDPDLLPLHIIKLQVDVSKRNLSRETMYQIMNGINDSLKGYEVMGEIRTGLFLIYVFRVSYENACKEYSRIKSLIESLVNRELSITCEMINQSDTTPDFIDDLLAR